ncbi:MAG TPA: thiamine pyrophosphate-dependent enzyme [Thermoplasmata archaeon]|nr:thiamine pyrophosphate-dependent enzyme [Thermoplasmata archaeon]
MTESPSIEPLPYTESAAAEALGPEWKSVALQGYRWMSLGRALDARMQGLQRQGRVGFYGAATGQEAVNVAAGLASVADDWVYPGLREQLVALVRGHPLGTYLHHLFADSLDPARGRNMPCHPSARDVQYVSMSSVIGTQISHAVGTAWGLRRDRRPGAALAFFGDGATSSNDFHAGLNFAGVFRVPVLFCCTNNQWAISVPVERQTRSATLASKARAYGFEGVRVDGTDFLAAYAALSAALRRIRAGSGPELIEFLLYRMTAHSSSDDPGRYQPPDWAARARAFDPFGRLDQWLTREGLLTPSVRQSIAEESERQVRAAVEAAEATSPPSDASVTEDVYSSAGSEGAVPRR